MAGWLTDALAGSNARRHDEDDQTVAARRAGLDPDQHAARLHGDTLDELTADAVELADQLTSARDAQRQRRRDLLVRRPGEGDGIGGGVVGDITSSPITAMITRWLETK